LLRAYSLVGYRPRRDYRYVEINRALREKHPAIVEMIAEGFRNSGGTTGIDGTSGLLWVNGEFTVSIVIARCTQTAAGAKRWKLRLDTGLLPDITVAVRMDAENQDIVDFYLLPRIDVLAERLKLADQNGLLLDAYRYDDLGLLFSFSTQVMIREAA
jgi:hypothetical protein